MKRFTSFVAGIIFGGAAMYFAFTLIVVQSDSGTFVIQKSAPSLSDIAYVDVSSWGAGEWAQHLELQRDLIATGHGDVIIDSAPVEMIEDVFKAVREGMKN
ncbi:hypothetical protein Pla110_31180 [Polystyrenella longa]|uniref:Uncharacterized protein n=1 Tax=Polystyrenella longa TaxID=2528007 RepID=A0A518CQ73_9PLAN|nr:hypothetical protein [Polystyrenella longa]QDU81377.1 hypothetical protein Pla110_31180 [Polystyrenella longa]